MLLNFFLFYGIILSHFFKIFYHITGKSFKVMITLKSKGCKILNIYEIKTMLTCTYLIASSSSAYVSCLLDQFSGPVKHVSIGVNHPVFHNDYFFLLDNNICFTDSCQNIPLRSPEDTKCTLHHVTCWVM